MLLFDKEYNDKKYKEFEDYFGKWFDHFPSSLYDELKLVLNTVKHHKKTKTIYPDDDEIFRVYKETAPEKVKVVIIGQDPYPGPKGQAIGRAFACGVRPSASMRKIVEPLYPDKDMMFEFNEIDFDFTLQHWVDQGVFLLNTALTVVAREPDSHTKIGWDALIKVTIDVLRKKLHIVWFLWGGKAKKLVPFIPAHHMILTAEHPAFASKKHEDWNCDNFDRANEYFVNNNIKPINWHEKVNDTN